MEAGVVRQNVGQERGLKRNSFSERFKKQKYLQAMVIPGIIWMVIFCYIPMLGIVIAFKNYNLINSMWGAPWVGLMHFKRFINHPDFWIVLNNTLGISFFKIVIGFPLPIIFAILLNELQFFKFKRIVQTISYLPHFLSWVILGGLMINWLAETGLFATILANLHMVPPHTTILAEPKYFWQVAVTSDIWKELGWSSIIYLAAIAGIDQELYESATIDGAGRLRKITAITVPCIKGTISVLFVLTVSNLLSSNFEQVLVLNNSLNSDSSNVIDLYIYQQGLRDSRYSFATAVNVMKSGISLMFLLVANGVTKRLTGASLY